MLSIVSNRLAQIVLLLTLLAGLVALRMHDPAFIHRWRQLTFDAYNRMMPRQMESLPAASPIKGVAIVDIDEASLRRYGQWPWPRTLVAKIPEVLKSMGAKSIAFDMVFPEHDRTSPARIAKNLPQTPTLLPVEKKLETLPDNDALFAKTIAKTGNVVIGFVSAASGQSTHGRPTLKASFFNDGINPDPQKFIFTYRYFTTSLPAIVDASAGEGSFAMRPDGDGIVRSVPMLVGQERPDGQVRMYPSLSLEALRVALHKGIYFVKSYGQRVSQGYGIQSIRVGGYTIPTDSSGKMRVYYAGHRYWRHLYIPAWKILQDDPAIAKLVKDRIILVGTSAIGLFDLRASPLNASLPGVEVHAEMLEQMLEHQYLYRPGYFKGFELCATGAISLGIIFLSPFIGTGLLTLIVALLLGGGIGGAIYAYGHYHLLFAPVYPSLTVIVIFIVSSVLNNLRSESERRAIREAFGHYISQDLLEELTKDPAKLKLGGEVREISVMFTDIRNFTTISESMDPADLIRMMNDFLTPMTSCVLENRGTVDKYMGDAMMAFWNAPLDDRDHARHACAAALQMLEALNAVNAKLRDEAEKNGKPYHELRAGIGINTGQASIGNMGSRQRFAYSALGDTVNLASRLEGQTKGYGIQTMISASVLKQAPEFAVLEIDLLTVKGRTEPERVYTLLGDADMAASETFKVLSSAQSSLLEAYRAQKWEEALVHADACENLRPDLAGLYACYRQRISNFQQNPPAPEWRGIWVAKDKH